MSESTKQIRPTSIPEASEEECGQLIWNFACSVKEPEKKPVPFSSEERSVPAKEKKRGRPPIIQSHTQTNQSEEYSIKVIRRPGGSCVSIELHHPLSGYRERIVLIEEKATTHRINSAKKQLINCFNVEKKLGMHWNHKHRRGGDDEGDKS